MSSGDGRLDEIVFGPPAHADTPHFHTHKAGEAPVPDALHDHHHFHPGGWADSSVHHHRHVHADPPRLQMGQLRGSNP